MRGFLLPGIQPMSIKDRLIQFILRGKDEMSPEARKVSKALEDVQSKSQGLRDEFDKAKSAQGLATAFRTTSDAADRVRSTREVQQRGAPDLAEAGAPAGGVRD